MITPAVIVHAAAAVYGITAEAVLSPSRRTVHVQARWLAMALTRHLTGQSYHEIGTMFGRDHSAVMHACRKMAAALSASTPRRAAFHFLSLRERFCAVMAADAAALAAKARALMDSGAPIF